MIEWAESGLRVYSSRLQLQLDDDDDDDDDYDDDDDDDDNDDDDDDDVNHSDSQPPSAVPVSLSMFSSLSTCKIEHIIQHSPPSTAAVLQEHVAAPWADLDDL